MTAQSVTAPSHGTAVLNGDGTVTYTPAVGYVGPDSFSYTAVAAGGKTATAVVSMTVAAIAADDNATGTPDTATKITLFTNDTPSAGATFDPATLRIFDPVAAAWVSHVVKPGEGTWDVSGSQLEFTPITGYSGTSSMRYEVTDTAASTVTARASVFYPPTLALAYTNVAPPGIGEWGIGVEATLLGFALVLFAGIRRRRLTGAKHRAA
jgi:hypothetical protein